MNSKIKVSIISVIAIICYFVFFSNSDKKEIRKLINNLETSLEYDKPLKPISIASRLRDLSNMITSDFSARAVGEEKTRSVDNLNQIKEYAVVATKYFPNINIISSPALITLSGNQATASMKVSISGKDKQAENFRELFDITLELLKIDSKWKLSGVSAERLTPED